MNLKMWSENCGKDFQKLPIVNKYEINSLPAVVLVVILTFLCVTSATTFASIHKSKAVQHEIAIGFDGVWSIQTGKYGKNAQLISEIVTPAETKEKVRKSYVIYGKDSWSTWSAIGVIEDGVLVSRGSGVTNNGISFIYESEISIDLETGHLLDDWQATFSKSEKLKGKDVLHRLDSLKPANAAR
jgi:hypothetical protein